MPTPVRAELTHALSELRLAAEALKSFDSDAADQLEAAIGQHASVVKEAAELAADRDRLVGQCDAALGAVARAKQYPTQITARADVLDRAATLAKSIRVIQAQLDKTTRR